MSTLKNISKPTKGDNTWLGIHGVTTAALYKGKKYIGSCIDTPVAISYVMFEYGVTRFVSQLNSFGMKTPTGQGYYNNAKTQVLAVGKKLYEQSIKYKPA